MCMFPVSDSDASYFCRRVTHRRVMLFYRCVTMVFFRNFYPSHRRFDSRVINFKLLKLVSRPILAHTALAVKFSTLRHALILTPPSGHLPPVLLAIKRSPLRPAVILTPTHPSVILCSTHPASSTPAGGHPHPSPPSSYLLPISSLPPEMGDKR